MEEKNWHLMTNQLGISASFTTLAQMAGKLTQLFLPAAVNWLHKYASHWCRCGKNH